MFDDDKCRLKAIMNTIKIFYMAQAKENISIYGVVSIAEFNMCV